MISLMKGSKLSFAFGFDLTTPHSPAPEVNPLSGLYEDVPLYRIYNFTRPCNLITRYVVFSLRTGSPLSPKRERQLNVYLSSAIHIISVFRKVFWVFIVVFVSSVIQITLVFSIVKIITDTVWLHVAFQLADILIADVNGSYHVIFQPVAMDWINCESQITTLMA